MHLDPQAPSSRDVLNERNPFTDNVTTGRSGGHPSSDADPTRVDRAADPQHEGRLEERERLQQAARPPGAPKTPQPPQ